MYNLRPVDKKMSIKMIIENDEGKDMLKISFLIYNLEKALEIQETMKESNNEQLKIHKNKKLIPKKCNQTTKIP